MAGSWGPLSELILPSPSFHYRLQEFQKPSVLGLQYPYLLKRFEGGQRCAIARL